MNIVRSMFVTGLLLSFAHLSVASPPAEIQVPRTGTPSERVEALWDLTRGRMSGEAGSSLTDEQWMARGKPLIEVWESLEKELGDDPAAAPINSIARLIEDFYGRPHSTPQRRVEIRNWARSEYGNRVQQIETRMH